MADFIFTHLYKRFTHIFFGVINIPTYFYQVLFQELQIVQFKNHVQTNLRFSKPVVCFAGLNGAGKTNLLDAIYYLCITKSYFASTDAQLITHEFDFFRLAAKVLLDNNLATIVGKMPMNGKKEFSLQNVVYEKISDHIGKMPAVMITPYDVDLISDGSEVRRKFYDNILSQTNTDYLLKLMQYNKLLIQRNALLKQFARVGKRNLSLLQTYDEQLISIAPFIFKMRKQALPLLLNHCKNYYQQLSGGKEDIEIVYESDLNQQTFANLLKQNLEKDLVTQRTNAGIHKDDLQFTMGNQAVKKFGSQGQQKSFILSLKLAQWKYIQTILQKNPFLLIDDFFDRLDEQRAAELMKLLPNDGQIFISDTDKNRLEKLLRLSYKHFEIHEVENGKIISTSVK